MRTKDKVFNYVMYIYLVIGRKGGRIKKPFD